MLNSRLPPALVGRRIAIGGDGPSLCAYASARVFAADASADATAPPLLLLHGVNVSASAAEMRPLFDRYGVRRPTLALELPGFGSSQRGPLGYTPALMAQAVLRAAQEVRQRGFTQPIDLLALSLSCEFAALAVLEQPSWFRSVALVSPTGLESGNDEPYRQGRTKEAKLLRRVLSARVGEIAFRWLTTPSLMRWVGERAWGSPVIDETLLAYEQITARQPGARFAPAAFIAGALSTEGIAERYALMAPAIWLAHGVRGEFADVGGLSRIGPPAQWRCDAFNTGAMPHLEAPRLFMARYDAFLDHAAASAIAADAPAPAPTVGSVARLATRAYHARRWSPATAGAAR